MAIFKIINDATKDKQMKNMIKILEDIMDKEQTKADISRKKGDKQKGIDHKETYNLAKPFYDKSEQHEYVVGILDDAIYKLQEKIVRQ